MPSSTELEERIAAALPGADVKVDDLTGGGDHFRAEIVSDRFEGLSRIQQHRLVYDVFGVEIGGPIHALSIKTSSPKQPARPAAQGPDPSPKQPARPAAQGPDPSPKQPARPAAQGPDPPGATP